MLQHVLTGLCDLVYPPHCLICKTHLLISSPGDILCQNCQENLVLNTPPFCLKCSRHRKNIAHPKCHECTKADLQFDFAWAACLYVDPLKTMITQFKYNQKTYLRKPFTQFITNFIQIYHLDIEQFDIIVPIPLFPSRLIERGYNQSQLLAEQIARKYHIHLSLKNLVRIRNTEHQTFLTKKERWTNIQGAFRIINSAEFSGKNILIIDDLLTTGATVSEASATLKDAGGKTVGVLTLAITV